MRVYSDEVREFIQKNAPGTRTDALTELINKSFGTAYSQSQIRAYKKNHKLQSGLKGGSTKPRCYTEEIAEFIKTYAAGIESGQLTELVNAKFETAYTVGQIRAYKKNHKITSGISTHFEKGHISHNAGKSGLKIPGSEKGWFKKGSRPHNWVPVGSETITTDGYLAVKLEEPNVWEFKHKLVWRKAHGEIPENMKIIFLDRNHLNVTPQNLALVSNDEMLEMNRKRMICEDAELTKIGVQIARLNRIVSKRRKTSNEPKKRKVQ